MRRLLLLLAALLGLVLLAGCSSGSGTVTNSGPTEFATAMSQPGTVVVDVRTPAEYAAGHVAGAVNIDVESADFGTRIAELPKDTTYALYCRSGRRSAVAADQMAAEGFTVVNLQGGFSDLQSAGVPTAS